MKPNIITISGPSAAGKSFLVDKIIDKYPNITEIIGLTTRPKREGEINGKSGLLMTMCWIGTVRKSWEIDVNKGILWQ